MFWVSTHYRLRQIYWDESVELVRDYNERMRSFFDSQTCGEFNYIDVYNMTAALATQYNSEAVQMSYDQVHWGLEVNLVKAQIVLNALAVTP